jgi:hypothetical protein
MDLISWQGWKTHNRHGVVDRKGASSCVAERRTRRNMVRREYAIEADMCIEKKAAADSCYVDNHAISDLDEVALLEDIV